MASIPIPKAELNGVTNGDVAHVYDVIIVGAGFSGIANLHRLREDGLNCHVFEAGSYPVLPAAASQCIFPHLPLCFPFTSINTHSYV